MLSFCRGVYLFFYDFSLFFKVFWLYYYIYYYYILIGELIKIYFEIWFDKKRFVLVLMILNEFLVFCRELEKIVLVIIGYFIS